VVVLGIAGVIALWPRDHAAVPPATRPPAAADRAAVVQDDAELAGARARAALADCPAPPTAASPGPTSGRWPVRPALSLLAAALLLTACSGTGPNASPTAPPASTVEFEHVHGLGVDPADVTVYVATRDGLFRSTGGELIRTGDSARDLMGFTITGPGAFLSSGHPTPTEDVPNPLGIVESHDRGATWTTLSLAGEVDFHALEVTGDTVYGYDATNAVVRASADEGRTWETRARLDALDIAADPADPTRVLATVQGGVAMSRDGGRSFAAPTGPQLTYLSWAPNGTVYGLDLDSGLFASTDGGTTWKQTGTTGGGRPQALTAVSENELLIATSRSVYRADSAGRSIAAIG
jgi:hypothetical protein